MSTTISMSDTALPHVGTAMIPNAHDVELATESSRTLGAMTQTTGDLMLTAPGCEKSVPNANMWPTSRVSCVPARVRPNRTPTPVTPKSNVSPTDKIRANSSSTRRERDVHGDCGP